MSSGIGSELRRNEQKENYVSIPNAGLRNHSLAEMSERNLDHPMIKYLEFIIDEPEQRRNMDIRIGKQKLTRTVQHAISTALFKYYLTLTNKIYSYCFLPHERRRVAQG